MTWDDIDANAEAVASAIRALGNGNAATQMGAIENLAKETRDGLSAIAASIEMVANSLNEVAEAVIYHADEMKECQQKK